MINGQHNYPFSQYGEMYDSDVAFSLIQSTLEQLREDELLKEKLTQGNNATKTFNVIVQFIPIPENCDIYIAGNYIGGSPLSYPLPEGKPILVRIAKAGYQPWEQTIIPTNGLIVKPELLRLAN